MLKSSSRWLKWTLGSHNLESRWKNYASRKITDTALPGQSAWLRTASLDKAGRPGTSPNHLPLITIALGTHQWTPKYLGDNPKVKLRPEGLICPSNGLPKWPLEFGLTIQYWTCTCMQRKTRRINANHWMEVNTSGGMDELVTWIKGPTFRMNNGQPTPNRRGRATPHRPSHNGGWSDA